MAHNVNDLGACVMAIEERVDSHEEDEQEDDSPLDAGRWRESPTEPCPLPGRELRANLPQGGPALAKKIYECEEHPFRTDGCRST